MKKIATMVFLLGLIFLAGCAGERATAASSPATVKSEEHTTIQQNQQNEQDDLQEVEQVTLQQDLVRTVNFLVDCPGYLFFNRYQNDAFLKRVADGASDEELQQLEIWILDIQTNQQELEAKLQEGFAQGVYKSVEQLDTFLYQKFRSELK